MTTIDEKNLELECLGDMTLTMVNVFRLFCWLRFVRPSTTVLPPLARRLKAMCQLLITSSAMLLVF